MTWDLMHWALLSWDPVLGPLYWALPDWVLEPWDLVYLGYFRGPGGWFWALLGPF